MKIIIDGHCENVVENSSDLECKGLVLLNFLQALGYDFEQLPLADLLRQYHNLSGQWQIVSPIHWQATHNDVFVTAYGKAIGLPVESFKQGFQVLEAFLALEGMTLHYHDEDIWLLSDPHSHPLRAKSVDEILGCSLMPELSHLDDSFFWQKLLTECQMLFASQLISKEINSIWPWGGEGSLSPKKNVKVCADEYFLPFARLCAQEVSLYQPGISLKKQDILLLKDVSQLHEAHQKMLNQIPTQWYWNNKAYLRRPSRWWRRLWRNK